MIKQNAFGFIPIVAVGLVVGDGNAQSHAARSLAAARENQVVVDYFVL